jgi:acyl-CoA synthetase (AMP-forming)/AMP-acid ligase II
VVCSLPHLLFGLYSFDDTVYSTPNPGAINIAPSSASWTSSQPDTRPSPPRTPASLVILIFTSGTTGKPKACAVANLQVLVVSNPHSMDYEHPQKYFPLRTYSALPLFHGTAFFTGLCYPFGNGGTLCLRRKFSASQFWKDVHDSRATRILYVGELCRYLLASPPSRYDMDHQCVVAHGNGLRREIWGKFKERFNVPEIREFYRSTEGAAKFDNHGNDGSAGAGCVGFQGLLLTWWEGQTMIVRFDREHERPWRDPKTGFCVRAKRGEAGECIGRVRNEATLTRYLGNGGATEEKLLRDAFVKGDVWQRMGDLLVHDQDWWVRFADRIGDTFRWKGENVSTGEVRDAICESELVEDAIVYGVRLNK